MLDNAKSPAESVAEQTLERLRSCIDAGTSFRLEAGAGAGKTYSLIEALKHLITARGPAMRKRHQQIACITYTNVACDQIKKRIDDNPLVLVSTIHAFLWPIIRPFQSTLRELVSQLPNWPERLEEVGGIGTRRVDYELGYPRAPEDADFITLHHDDVISLAVRLLTYDKFLKSFVARFPILLVDEYQDTDKDLTAALKEHVLDKDSGLLIGFFGDHWQKIYGEGCGSIEHARLSVIDKGANFRSTAEIVDVLNRMRPELPQQLARVGAAGSVAVFTTNNWVGARRTGQHWKDDLEAGTAHNALVALKTLLTDRGWDLSPGPTKILVLTHGVLAREQNYSGIAEIFSGRSEQFAKKENPHIAFLVDTVEPVCKAYAEKRYGEMLAAIGARAAKIRSHSDKAAWAKEMEILMTLRGTGTIGEVIDHLRKSRRLPIPEAVVRRESARELAETQPVTDEDDARRIEQLTRLRVVPYRQVTALDLFIDGNTPFSTKHGVKGAQFENVIVVCGRGWNHYDFNQMLELARSTIPAAKKDFYERNRNLFYVACSRPQTRLALLFTQRLSTNAMNTLTRWFGTSAVSELAQPTGS